MTVRLLGDLMIALDGICPIDDAEVLLRYLLDHPRATVDWRGCESAHTAVIQVLMVTHVKLIGPPHSDLLAKFIAPRLRHTGDYPSSVV